MLDRPEEAGRPSQRLMVEYAGKDGTAFLCQVSAPRLPDGRLLAVGRDVSRRQRTTERASLVAHVFEAAPEGIVIADNEACIVEVNTAFTQITGYSRQELIGRNPRLLRSGHHEPEFYRAMWSALLENARWQGEMWNRKKNGEVFVTHVTIKALEGAPGRRHYIGFFSDITEPRRQQERIEGLAYYDPLTGLPNRVLFADRMQRALLAAQRKSGMVAVCCLDLNEFKPINDRYGHMAGDEVLVAVALRLQAAMRAEDTVARVGGDEFALLLSGVHSASEADALVTRVLQAIAQPCKLKSGDAVSVTASLGVALYPDAGLDVDTLLRRADEAMYVAKRKGRAQTHSYRAGSDAGRSPG